MAVDQHPKRAGYKGGRRGLDGDQPSGQDDVRQLPIPRTKSPTRGIMSALPDSRLTALEYLEIERRADRKSQFFHGEVFSMAGASARHNLIVANAIRALGNALQESTCRVFASDLRVVIDPDDHYVYPDVVIVCGEPEYLDEASDTLTNPTLIVEVLSESTERYDRGLKFAGYRALPSVQTVMFVSQDRACIEVYSRQPDGRWLLVDSDTCGGQIVHIAPLYLRSALQDIYQGVDFSSS